MKAFVLVAVALLLIGGMTACQSGPMDADIDSPQQAEQIADESVDESLVAEDDTVELGEMV